MLSLAFPGCGWWPRVGGCGPASLGRTELERIKPNISEFSIRPCNLSVNLKAESGTAGAVTNATDITLLLILA